MVDSETRQSPAVCVREKDKRWAKDIPPQAQVLSPQACAPPRPDYHTLH